MTYLVQSPEGRKALNIEPSKSLGILAQSRTDLFSEQGGGFCYEAGINIVGALLLYKNLQQFKRVIQQTCYTINPEIEQAIYFLDNVALENTDLIAKRVLLKITPGFANVGLVLEGDFAGLLLYPVRKKGRSFSARVGRIFNDEPITENPGDYHPYSPLMVVNTGFNPYETEVENELDRQFRKMYIEYATKIKKKIKDPRQLYVSDILFALCDELNIHIDKSKFLYARSLDKHV